jgi:hypothetical protein
VKNIKNRVESNMLGRIALKPLNLALRGARHAMRYGSFEKPRGNGQGDLERGEGLGEGDGSGREDGGEAGTRQDEQQPQHQEQKPLPSQKPLQPQHKNQKQARKFKQSKTQQQQQDETQSESGSKKSSIRLPADEVRESRNGPIYTWLINTLPI